MKSNTKVLIDGLLAGNERALAQILTIIENKQPDAAQVLETLYPKSGRAYVIGITGSPGAGKSTLVDKLAEALLLEKKKVAVLAVDPSSPFSGGSLLGDRIRMVKASADQSAFIRSMASRGSLGGLGPRTFEAVIALDAAGYDYILVETVGVGQAEVEIVQLADSVLVVLVPGMGDSVQAFKAGILEIADLFVVNKADYTGADRLKKDLLALLSLSKAAWRPPIVETVASEGKGTRELLLSIRKHAEWAESSGEKAARRKKILEAAFHKALAERATEKALEAVQKAGGSEALLLDISERKLAPSLAAKRLVK